jgi:hypothetical protein
MKRIVEPNMEAASHSSIILYTTADGKVAVDVFFAQDNFWLTQKTMDELFGVKTPAVNKHLKISFHLWSRWRMPLFPFWKQLPPTAKPVQPGSFNCRGVVNGNPEVVQ